MSYLALAGDLFREARFWLGGSSCPWGAIAGFSLLIFWCGVLTGLAIGACIFSSGCLLAHCGAGVAGSAVSPRSVSQARLMQTPISPEVQELTLRFESFSLSIRVEFIPNQIDTSLPSTVTSVSLNPGDPDFHDPHNITAGLETLALAASTPSELRALPLDFLATYVDRLRGSGNASLTSQERIGRAFRAGVAAGCSTPFGRRIL